MNKLRPLALAALIACLPAIGACSSSKTGSGQPASGGGITGAISSSITSALDKAQEKLRTQPITVSHNDNDLPAAEITPQGDFIVDGKTVAITPAQRTELLAYRKQLVAVASQGIEVGKQGAKIGINAASTAIAAALSGKSDEEIQQKVKAQTKGIREAAAKICNRLPTLMTEQQKLASVLPAFKPYATMTQQDIDDCRTDALNDDD